jgi:predicted membrane protein
MKLNKKFPLLQPQWIALVLIIVIPAIVNQCYFDKPSYKANTTDFKNTLELALIFSVAILGYHGLRNLAQKWVLNTWKAIYGLSVAFLTIATFVEAFIFRYSYKGQFRFMSIKQMLFSPIIYILLLIIYTKVTPKKNV